MVKKGVACCIQDTGPYRRAWPIGFVQPLGRVRRASKDILHTTCYCFPMELGSFFSGGSVASNAKCYQLLGRARIVVYNVYQSDWAKKSVF